MLKKLLFTLAVVLVATLLYAANYLSAVLSAGSGFSAKNICSGFFLSGLPGQVIVDEALVSASPLLSNISFSIDKTNHRVDTRLFGYFQRRAVFSEGTGCTLLSAGQQELHRTLQLAPVSRLDETLEWPQGSAAAPLDERLAPLLVAAFAEPDRLQARHTKAVVVIHKGRLVAEKYASGIDANTPLIGWSMTKSITNLLIGLLVHDGQLQLFGEAPVPAWHSASDDARAGITIDQLLRMSSGLEFNEDYALYSDVTRMLSTEADAPGFAASKPLFKAPDSLWAYSSGTSNILSGVIRRSVGGRLQDYYDFTHERLFEPLGIRSASLETDNNGTFIGSSYMYASARDWARLGQFCLQDGTWQGRQLLPEGWLTYSTTPTATNPQNDYGAHFWLNADPKGGLGERTWPTLPNDTYSMNGFQGQRVVIVPSKELVVVRMGFSPGKNRGIEQLVAGLMDVLSPEQALD